MFKMWCKIFSDTHLVKDMTIEDPRTDINRTKKVLDGLNEACHDFDLAVPLWLDSNINSFKRHSRTRFTKDNFIEQIDFDYLEIQMLEED